MNSLPVTIHVHSDSGCCQYSVTWRNGWPVPTFADTFWFMGLDYAVELVAWRLGMFDDLTLELHLRDTDCDCEPEVTGR